ncbi:MAG: tripartite tricarboxylate transporter TctB family protein [Steroidobacteraceae bacterium]|nr:tripartite tricarboxylate transporter TctB family protein [Steroidobacteraceae bacterium]
MSEGEHADHRAAARVVTVEVVVALLFVALGAVVMIDSLRLGAGWADDGPQSGYFPFYVGTLMVVSGVANLFIAVRRRWLGSGPFVSRTELGHVLHVLVPTAIFAALIGFIGLYVAAAVFIGWFMVRHGRFRWYSAAAVALGVPLLLFMVFERWFLVPLPKGPLEAMLGL